MKLQKRKMGIDYGDRRIGVAVSDPLGITARGVQVVYQSRRGPDIALKKLVDLVQEYEVDLIIVGLPTRTDGKDGPFAQKAEAFAKKLEEAAGVKVLMYDERYTSVMAGRIFHETGTKIDRKSGQVDMMAAEILLSDYLKSRGN